LEEALAVCRQAIRVAGPIDPEELNPGAFSAVVMGALTIDEIASRLGQHHLAREPLENALLLLESVNRKGRRVDELLRREDEIRTRLEELRSAP
jgi:hypothetical protein